MRLLSVSVAAAIGLPAAALAQTPDSPLSDPQLAPLIAAAFAEARAECSELGGELELPETLRHQRVDLTEDGTPDLILSEEGAFCAPDLGFLGSGSAGARVHVVIGTHVQTLLPGNWLVTDLQFPLEGEVLPPTRVLVMAVHGLFCDSFGAAPCFVAFAWDGERMVSVLDGVGVWGAERDDGEP